MKKYIIIAAVLILIGLIVYFYNVVYSNGYKNGMLATESKYETITETIEVTRDVIVPEYIYKTITVKQKVNVDSLWEEAKKYWQNKIKPVEKFVYVEKEYDGKYIAKHYEETNDYELGIEFVSPIPLHPMSYLSHFFNFKKNEITKKEITVNDNPAFWIRGKVFTIITEEIEPFGEIGIGYNLINNKHFRLSFENGIVYNFNEKKFNNWRTGIGVGVGF